MDILLYTILQVSGFLIISHLTSSRLAHHVKWEASYYKCSYPHLWENLLWSSLVLWENYVSSFQTFMALLIIHCLMCFLRNRSITMTHAVCWKSAILFLALKKRNISLYQYYHFIIVFLDICGLFWNKFIIPNLPTHRWTKNLNFEPKSFDYVFSSVKPKH